MTCLQSKAFAETQCHQLITSFALRKVACTNRICNTSVVQHKNCHVGICTWRESRSLCSCRSSKAVFLALPDWWTLFTKKTPEICWSISRIFCCVHIIFISTHLKTNQTYPAQQLTGQRNISTIWRCIGCMSYWKMAMFLHFPPDVSINSPGNFLGEFHQGSTPPWVPSSIHSLDQRLPPLTSTKIGTNLEKPIELTLQVWYVFFLSYSFIVCIYMNMCL